MVNKRENTVWCEAGRMRSSVQEPRCIPPSFPPISFSFSSSFRTKTIGVVELTKTNYAAPELNYKTN